MENMKIFDINKVKTGTSNVPSILASIDLDKVNFEDFLTARKCINLLEESKETQEEVKNLVLTYNDEDNNFKLYYQKFDKDNKLIVDKLIWTIRSRPINESINQCNVLENCIVFLQAFHDALLLDKLINENVVSEIHVKEVPTKNEFEKYHITNSFPKFQPIKEGQNTMQSLTEKEEIDILEKCVIDRWKSKIISITLFMKNDRSYHDLNIFHKVLNKKYWMDKDTISKLYDICDTINLHVVLSNKTHVLPVHDISKVTLLDEDAFIQYLYDRIHNK